MPHLRHRRLLAVVPVVLLSLALPATVPAHAQERGLTGPQERTVLRLVDLHCGDTWCEGDRSFRFLHLSCDPQRRACALRLLIAPVAEGPPCWHARTAHVPGYGRYGQLVTTTSGAPALTPGFSTAVGTSVLRVAATVPLPPRPHGPCRPAPSA